MMLRAGPQRADRRRADHGRPHAGLAIVVGVDHGEFGEILRTLADLFESRPDRGDWRDYTCFVSRGARLGEE